MKLTWTWIEMTIQSCGPQLCIQAFQLKSSSCPCFKKIRAPPRYLLPLPFVKLFSSFSIIYVRGGVAQHVLQVLIRQNHHRAYVLKMIDLIMNCHAHRDSTGVVSTFRGNYTPTSIIITKTVMPHLQSYCFILPVFISNHLTQKCFQLVGCLINNNKAS